MLIECPTSLVPRGNRVYRLTLVSTAVIVLCSLFVSNTSWATQERTVITGPVCEPIKIIDQKATWYGYPVPLVDPESLEHLFGGFWRDKDGVYFGYPLNLLENHSSGASSAAQHRYSSFEDCGGMDAINSMKKVESVLSPTTLELLPSESSARFFAKDAEAVYQIDSYAGDLIVLEQFDAASFMPFQRIEHVAISGGKFGRNKTHYITDVDFDNLEAVLSEYPEPEFTRRVSKITYSYYRDINGVYWYRDKIEEADLESFEVAIFQTAVDKSGVFVRGKKIAERDGEFTLEYGHSIGKDRSRVYDLQEGEIIPGLDAPSFEFLSFQYAKDKNHIYCCNINIGILEGADPDTFEIIGSTRFPHYSKDKNRVYFRGKVVDGASPDTFELYRSENGSVLFGRDRGRVFYDGVETDRH